MSTTLDSFLGEKDFAWEQGHGCLIYNFTYKQYKLCLFRGVNSGFSSFEKKLVFHIRIGDPYNTGIGYSLCGRDVPYGSLDSAGELELIKKLMDPSNLESQIAGLIQSIIDDNAQGYPRPMI
jgi:hypothetical protein